MKKADEYDILDRKIYIWKPGEISAIKRRLRRRERHDAKREIRNEENP